MTPDPNLVALAASRNFGTLATIKRDGRPQLSSVNFAFDLAAAVVRMSVVDGRRLAGAQQARTSLRCRRGQTRTVSRRTTHVSRQMRPNEPGRPPYRARLRADEAKRTRPPAVQRTSSGRCGQTRTVIRHTRMSLFKPDGVEPRPRTGWSRPSRPGTPPSVRSGCHR